MFGQLKTSLARGSTPCFNPSGYTRNIAGSSYSLDYNNI